jgi:hypothetical protein
VQEFEGYSHWKVDAIAGNRTSQSVLGLRNMGITETIKGLASCNTRLVSISLTLRTIQSPSVIRLNGNPSTFLSLINSGEGMFGALENLPKSRRLEIWKSRKGLCRIDSTLQRLEWTPLECELLEEIKRDHHSSATAIFCSLNSRLGNTNVFTEGFRVEIKAE